MSREAKVLAATVMRSLPSGAYHARRALAALESENAALQEELRKYQPGQGEGWPDDRHEFAGRLTALREAAEALQERAEKAEAALRRIASMSPSASQAGWFIAVGIAKNALSPTQESDQ